MKTRVISAVIAVLIIIAVTWFFKADGIYLLGTLVVLGAIYEYSKLTFSLEKSPRRLRFTFMALAIAVYGISLFHMDLAAGVASIAAILFLSLGILTVKKTDDLRLTLKIQSAGLVGFFYCGIFPAMAIGTLGFENGLIWFFGLLAIVFAGDTFAYLFGRSLGKHKLLEPVSPKKTIEGSIGGLIGSATAAGVLAFYFAPEIPLGYMIFVGLVSGAFAQVGDLFESLLKRIADVKDSGAIMPGHGGFLDRIDGVLFAAPIYYVLVRLYIA